jgi:subtilisin family serine protease
MKLRVFISFCAIAALALVWAANPLAQGRNIGINVTLNTDLTPEIVNDLSRHGTVLNRFAGIDAVTMRAPESELAAIRSKPYVTAANPDAERQGSPVDTVTAANFGSGINTWNLDAVNVTNFGAAARSVTQDGSGVYVAVLDSGLLDSWRQYFPEQRIATRYATAFSGGGGEVGQVSTVPNQWEHDQNSHGTHVTSTVLGFNMGTRVVNGVAPLATVIPVKVLNQSGSGWSSVVAAGIIYVTDLARGPLAGKPVVINMSLGGSELDAVEKAAIDYAVANGVIVVAAAGNEGKVGMTFPGAYEPVISVAAAGWTGEWTESNWWRTKDVADPTAASDFYITDFSGRQKAGQDLDVTAPGSWVVGPYQTQSGTPSFFYLGGTSMATPHVAGIAALMLQQNPALNQLQIENILETTAIPLPPACRTVVDPNTGRPTEFCWETDASGAGLVTANAALASGGGSTSTTTRARRR